MPRRRQIYYDNFFPTAMIQLPEWPLSKDVVEKMVEELARNPDLGERVLDTLVYVARKTAILANEKTIRLVLYFTKDDEEFSFTALWVDDEEQPSTIPNPKTHRLPPNDYSN